MKKAGLAALCLVLFGCADKDSTGTDTAMTADTGMDCASMGWECGVGKNDSGFDLDCDGVLGCANSGEWCNNHACEVCNTDVHCGAACEACGEDVLANLPRCDGMKCVECLQDEDCPTGKPVCNTETHTCE